MKISASVYSNKTTPILDLVAQLDRLGVDLIHIDCNNDLSVFNDIAAINRNFPDLAIDLHIIAPEVEKFLPHLAAHKIDFVCFQREHLSGPINWPNQLPGKKGLAILAATDIAPLHNELAACDFILFMTTVPGQSGGVFSKDHLKKIRRLRESFPGKAIHVDGGVNNEIAFFLRNLGVDTIISGSFLVNAPELERAFWALRSSKLQSHVKISEVMIGVDELPVLNADDVSLQNALLIIEKFRLGFALVAEPDGRFAGLITNADVRRALIKHLGNLSDIPAADLINTKPATIGAEQTISEMLKKIKELPFPVLFMPVVDAAGKLAGAITFNHLIKSEL